MASTKDRILTTSILLFNGKGFVNVTLRDIASTMKISTGNLTYHFKNKDVIMRRAYEKMEEELNEMLASVRLIPNFKNINEQVLPFFRFQKKYEFFYVDILEIIRAYPDIAAKHRLQNQIFMDSIKAMIDYNVGTGNLRRARTQEGYTKLAHTIWMVMALWLSQQKIRGVEENERSARDNIWNLIGPYLTDQGLQEYKKLEY